MSLEPQTIQNSGHSLGGRACGGRVAFALCLLLIGWQAGCRRPEVIDESGVGDPLPVKVMRIERVTSKREIGKFIGSIRPARKSSLSFTQGGQIDRIFVQAGDVVQLGQALAELKQPRIAQKEKTLRSALQTKNDRIAELEALPQSVEERRQLIAQLRLELNQLEAGLTEQPNPDRLLEIQKQVASLSQQSTASELAQLKQEVANLEGELKDVEIQIQEGVLKAPYAGRISSRNFDEGAVAGPGRAVFELLDQKLTAWVGIPSHLASKVRTGAEVFITVDGKVQNGRVRSVLPELDASSRTRTILLELTEPGENVVAGMIATMLIWIDAPKTGFWLPVTSLNRDANGSWSVYTVARRGTDAAPVKRALVKILRQEQNWVLVDGVLEDGEFVVEAGTHRVVPGQRVVPTISSTRKAESDPTSAESETSASSVPPKPEGASPEKSRGS